MKNLHRRVIEFTFFTGDLPMFETDQQAQEWYACCWPSRHLPAVQPERCRARHR